MRLYSTIALCLAMSASAAAAPVTVKSPDGAIEATLTDETGQITLAISRAGIPVLLPSAISMDIEGHSSPARLGKPRKADNVREHTTAPFYRQKDFTAEYSQAEMAVGGNLSITLRVYDDGVAYRFSTSAKKPATVKSESASFRVPGESKVWLAHSTNPGRPEAMAFQNTYSATPISSASPLPAFLPATVEVPGDIKMTLLEADLEAYPGMFVSADSIACALDAVFAPYPAATGYYPWRMQEYVTETAGHIAVTRGRRDFPWRVMAITTDDRQMPVSNLVYALASPSRLGDTSWIKPGKVAWDWWNDWGLSGVPFEAGINNDTYRHYIDFASRHGIEYIVLDEGWYEPASGDMLTPISAIDLPALVEYAGSKGVGIFLWTVFNVLDSQLEEACAKYSGMGIKGFKVDFLDRDDQKAVEMAYRIADASARHRMMLDYHGFYKPTGLNRTYPNIINFEAVFGMEEMKWSDPSVDMPLYDVTFPYIRMMSGPVDYTPGAMRNASKADWRAVYSNPVSQGTRAHQLAAYIVHDSPFTMLADSPSAYKGEEECVDFISSLPVVFDRTEIIDGRMGSHIVTMREKEGSFFVGGMTSWEPRDCDIYLSFLPEGKRYRAVIMSDGPNAARQARDYSRLEKTVDSNSSLGIHMAPGGGFAIRIDPINY